MYNKKERNLTPTTERHLRETPRSDLAITFAMRPAGATLPVSIPWEVEKLACAPIRAKREESDDNGKRGDKGGMLRKNKAPGASDIITFAKCSNANLIICY